MPVPFVREISFKRLRSLLIQSGILATFVLIPVWYRLPQTPPLFAHLYVSRFLILLPMLWAILWWIVLGASGLRSLVWDRWRAGWMLALLLLALWAFASQTWAFQRVAYPDVAATAALQFGIVALFAVVVACAGSLRGIVAVLVIGLVANAALTFAQAAQQGSVGLIGLGEFPYHAASSGTSILQAGSLRWVRPYGLLPHPNMLAGTLLVGVLAAGAWVLARRSGQRIAGIVIGGMGFGALLLTFSRSVWGGLGVGLLVMLLFLRPSLRQRGIVISMAAAVMVALIVAAGFFVAYRPLLAARVGEGQESVELRSISDRVVFTEFALRSIGERPLLGVGVGNFPWRTSYYIAETTYDLRGDNVHNVLLAVAAELSVVGLGLMSAAILCGVVAAWRAIRSSQGDVRAARVALLAIFVALLAVGMFDHYPYTTLHFQVAWWGGIGAAIGIKPHPDSAKLSFPRSIALSGEANGEIQR